MSTKKQDEKHLRILRELLKEESNKRCFDCGAKAPSYVNVTACTFVCTRCSGLLREFGHRVKSISASTFTPAEIKSLEGGSNARAKTIWLGSWSDITHPEPDSSRGDLVRDFMKNKYYHKLFYKEPENTPGNVSAPSIPKRTTSVDFPTIQLTKQPSVVNLAAPISLAKPLQLKSSDIAAKDDFEDFGDFQSPTSTNGTNSSAPFAAFSNTTNPSTATAPTIAYSGVSSANTAQSALPSPPASFASFPSSNSTTSAPLTFDAFSSPTTSSATPSFAAFGQPLAPTPANGTAQPLSSASAASPFPSLPTPLASPLPASKSADVDPYAALRGIDTDIAQRSNMFTAPATGGIKSTGGFTNEIKSLSSLTISTPSSATTSFASFSAMTPAPSAAPTFPSSTTHSNGGFAAFPSAPATPTGGFAAFSANQPPITAQRTSTSTTNGFAAFGNPLQPVPVQQTAAKPAAASASKDFFGDLTDSMKGAIANQPKPNSPYGAFGNFTGDSLI
ncbi:ArfGAP with FG repeats 1 [Rhizophlyctis rosea]|nr:ArfGAP with FG repeats 1 [Rhizophlyctis rosea]